MGRRSAYISLIEMLYEKASRLVSADVVAVRETSPRPSHSLEYAASHQFVLTYVDAVADVG